VRTIEHWASCAERCDGAEACGSRMSPPVRLCIDEPAAGSEIEPGIVARSTEYSYLKPRAARANERA